MQLCDKAVRWGEKRGPGPGIDAAPLLQFDPLSWPSPSLPPCFLTFLPPHTHIHTIPNRIIIVSDRRQNDRESRTKDCISQCSARRQGEGCMRTGGAGAWQPSIPILIRILKCIAASSLPVSSVLSSARACGTLEKLWHQYNLFIYLIFIKLLFKINISVNKNINHDFLAMS